MKHLKQKQDEQNEQNNQEVDVTQLSGQPEPTGVSKVALGGTAKTLMEHDDIQNGQWIDRLKGGEDKGIDDIEDAYAKLFEGLAGIMRCK